MSAAAAALVAATLLGCQAREQVTSAETAGTATAPSSSPTVTFPEQPPVSAVPAPPVPPAAAQTPPFSMKVVNANSKKPAPNAFDPGEMTQALAKVPRISPQDLKSEIDAGKVIVLDVRAGAYAAGHLPGARSIPLAQLPLSLASLPKDQTIVTYCA